MELFFILLVIFQIKHFIADYPLQNEYMLGKFKSSGWVKPLAAHCAVQAIFTYLISFSVFYFSFNIADYLTRYHIIALSLGFLDFIIHFVMDRIKASPKMLGRYESISKEQYKGLFESRQLAESGVKFPHEELSKESKRLVREIDSKFRSNKLFWWSLGFDQMVHHLTDIAIVYFIFKILSGGI